MAQAMPAERRLLSILVCDIVGSTELAESLDPEDFQLRLQSFFETCSDIVASNNGTIANYIGDGFVAYFGFPRADGTDVHHAINCGLAIIRYLEELRTGDRIRLSVRISIATGRVILGPMNVPGSGANVMASGRAAYLAARLQSIAAPNEVLVDDSSRALTAQSFDFSDTGQHLLKGLKEPARVWRVEGGRDYQLRFEERLRRLSPLVGRDEELDRILACWNLSQAGSGQVVVLSGEPGIGKSRIVFEAGRRFEESNARTIIFQCQETFENTPFHPVMQHLERVSGIEPNDSMIARRAKLDSFLTTHLRLSDDLGSLVLSAIAYPTESSKTRDDSTPEKKLQALISAIIDLAFDAAKTRPLVVIVEDAQWIDPTSKTLLDSFIDAITSAPILVLVTARSEYALDHKCQHLSQIVLDRLTEVQIRTLANTVMKRLDVADQLVNDIVRRSDGIPLYVEEIAQSVVDKVATPDESAADEDQPRAQFNSFPIPDSLQGSLLSRLDQLGDARNLAQIASVIGRDFDCEVLAKLARRDDVSIERELDALKDSGVFFSRYHSTRRILSFKHTLIREAAYESLLKRDAIVLHKRLADIYAEDYPELKDMHPEILAYHHMMSEQWSSAADFWLRAGLAAKDVGSNVEAKNRLEQGLVALERMPDNRSSRSQRMKLQLARGEVINAHYGPVMVEAQEALHEAAHIGDEIGDVETAIAAQTSLFTLKYVLGALPDAESLAAKLVERGRKTDDHPTAAIGLLGSGMCQFAMGKFHEAENRLEASLGYLDSVVGTAIGYPSKAFIYLSLIRHIFGRSQDAGALCERGIGAAREQRAIDLAAALGNSLYLHRMQDHVDRTETTCRELMDLTERKGFKMWYYQGHFFLGWVRAKRGDENGLAMMEEAMTRFRRAEELIEQSFFFGIMAERYLALGHAEQALRVVDLGFEIVERCDERFFESPLCLLKANCLERIPEPADPIEIDRLKKRATEIAEEQGAVAWHVEYPV